MSTRFKLEIDTLGGRSVVAISGIIDEGAGFAELFDLRGEVEIDLSNVRRINSYGVRLWIDAMRKFSDDVRVTIVRCSAPMVEQMNMIHNFFGKGRVKSFHAPMICEECEELQNALFEVDICRSLGGKLPEVACPGCGGEMEVDDIEDQYLFFLRIEGEEP